MTCLLVMRSLLLFCCALLAVGDTDTVQSTLVLPRPTIIARSPTDSITRSSCPVNDAVCARDWIGFEAIAQLHAQIDDDHNGSLDRLESDEFIREDLEHIDASSDIQASFHGTDDFISVHELWQIWISSAVYNWTVDEVVMWLVTEVELPQYADTFRVNAIDGRVLPRLALSSHAFATVLGIKNAVHKRKLSVKASDLVLFGPPKWTRRYYVDVIVAVSVLVTAACCWLSYHSRHATRSQTERIMKDLASLQSAEDSLKLLQKQLEEAKQEEQKIADDRHSLELRLQREVDKMKGENERIRNLGSADQKSELRVVEEELTRLRGVLSGMEYRLRMCCYPSAELQDWLQMTYEIETRYFERKRHAADTQLKAAKDMCEKLHSQKGRFLSAMRMAHTTSLDDTDQTIYSVRRSVEEVRKALQERMQRWQLIERICGFDIISNPGLAVLESQLKPSLKKVSKVSSVSNFASHLSVDMADEEMPSLAMLSQVTAGEDGVPRHLFPRIQSVPVLGSVVSSRQLAVPCRSTVQEELGEDTSSADTSRVSFDVGDDISLTTVSATLMSDDGAESPTSDVDQCSLDLRNRRSVTVPSSLADSAISLSTAESSVGLSSASRNRSSDESQQVLTPCQGLGPAEDCTSTSTVAKDKRRRSGLSRIFTRGRQKEL